MLLPELAQHQLLVARLDALHGALTLRLPLCFASAALRSGRRARAGEQRASGPASSGLPLVPRARARLQGREQQQQGVRPRLERRGLWEGLRAWVWVCSWNQVVCHGAWGRAGRALAFAGQLAWRVGHESAGAVAPTSSAGGAAAAASFVWIVSSIAFLQAFIAPRSSDQPVSRRGICRS